MADRLDAFPDATRAPRGHPWDEWLDGSVWRLERSRDFNGSPTNFCSTAWKRAHERGLKLRTHRDGNVVVIQASPNEVPS